LGEGGVKGLKKREGEGEKANFGELGGSSGAGLIY